MILCLIRNNSVPLGYPSKDKGDMVGPPGLEPGTNGL
jgi:hypothetical protein